MISYFVLCSVDTMPFFRFDLLMSVLAYLSFGFAHYTLCVHGYRLFPVRVALVSLFCSPVQCQLWFKFNFALCIKQIAEHYLYLAYVCQYTPAYSGILPCTTNHQQTLLKKFRIEASANRLAQLSYEVNSTLRYRYPQPVSQSFGLASIPNHYSHNRASIDDIVRDVSAFIFGLV